MPVDPIPARHLIAARILRWLLFGLCIGGLAYLVWEPYGFWGIALVAFSAVLWGFEISRGDQTENYIFENYEDPQR